MNPEERLRLLLARRADLVRFLASRLGGNEADAEDLLQHGLAKAFSGEGPREEDRLLPWFYQLLRNTAVDHIRSRRAAAGREELWMSDSLAFADDAAETRRQLCACLDALIETMPAAQAELVRRCELGGESVQGAAAALGLTPNAASAALHRARAALRGKLRDFCGDCAGGACLDCDCET